jgi:hypothetical protein
MDLYAYSSYHGGVCNWIVDVIANEEEYLKKQISIIQFNNIGAIYDSDGIFIDWYEGNKPPQEIEAHIKTCPDTLRVVYIFRRLVISSLDWPFSDSLEEALIDINKIQKDFEAKQGE